jgi:AraC-like DNA-binding protein
MISGKTFYIVHSLIWITLFAKLLISPEILFGLPHLNAKINRMSNETPKLLNTWNLTSMAEEAIQNQQDIRLKDKIDERILEIVTEIEDLAQTKHFFRNQKMTINEMANELGIPVSHLVYVFKYHSQLTFTEFRTFMRIEDAKNQIKEGFLRTNTLESLAIEVGFSSYNPFFSAFKKSTGFSPNEYSNNLLSK